MNETNHTCDILNKVYHIHICSPDMDIRHIFGMVYLFTSYRSRSNIWYGKSVYLIQIPTTCLAWYMWSNHMFGMVFVIPTTCLAYVIPTTCLAWYMWSQPHMWHGTCDPNHMFGICDPNHMFGMVYAIPTTCLSWYMWSNHTFGMV